MSPSPRLPHPPPIRLRPLAWLPLLAGLVLLAWWLARGPASGPVPAVPASGVSLEAPAQVEEVMPLPQRVEVPPALAALGRRLFHDRRLSRDDSLACADCHPLDRGGADGRPVSRGVAGRMGEMNAPTVLNSGFNFRQFWDGRAASLEEQAAGPIHNPREMDSGWSQALAKLAGDPDYRRLARQALGRDLDAAGMASALAAFQRTLVTPDAPFDRYLRGDAQALGADEREGWRLFRDLGCVACHQGINLGGNMFANLGLMGDFFADRPAKKADLGRYNITRREADRHVFKVPGLRNVARTAPYFHDGSVATLDEAVRLMARYQLGLELTEADRRRLVAFLGSLSGRLPMAGPAS